MKTLYTNIKVVLKENWEHSPKGVIGDFLGIAAIFGLFFIAMWVAGIAQGNATWSGFIEASQTIGYVVALIGFVLLMIVGRYVYKNAVLLTEEQQYVPEDSELWPPPPQNFNALVEVESANAMVCEQKEVPVTLGFNEVIGSALVRKSNKGLVANITVYDNSQVKGLYPAICGQVLDRDKTNGKILSFNLQSVGLCANPNQDKMIPAL